MTTLHLRVTSSSDLAAEKLVSGPAAGAVTARSTTFLAITVGAASSAEWCRPVPVAPWRGGAVFFCLVASGAVAEQVLECGALVCRGVGDGLRVVGRSGHYTDGENGESDEVELHGD